MNQDDPHAGSNGNWHQHDAQGLLDTIRQAAIKGMGGGGFPTADKLSAALAWRASNDAGNIQFIANGVACEPGIDADLWIIEQAPNEVLQGALIVARILDTDVVTLALGPRLLHQSADLTARWNTLTNPDRVSLHLHPASGRPAAGAERLLIEAITSTVPSPEQPPASQGYIVHNVTTLWAISRAIAGAAASERPVTIGGATQWLPIGAPIATLDSARQCNRDGGFWSSQPLAIDTQVSARTLALHWISPSTPAPCIGCGDCASVCPVAIDPETLHRIGSQLPASTPTVSDALSTHSPISQLQQAGLELCIECGACNAHCPSHIDLLAGFRHSKSRLAVAKDAAFQAQRASQRFARHQQRLAERAASAASKRSARLQRTRSWSSEGPQS